MWAYDKVGQWHDQFWKEVITHDDLQEEISIDEEYYWVIKRGKSRLLLPSWIGDKSGLTLLPLRVGNSTPIDYRSKVYYLITEPIPVRVKAEQTMTVRELIDTFCDYEHSNPEHFLAWKIIVFTGVWKKIMARVSSNAGFGKDSIVKNLSYLTSEQTVVQNPTIAKMEYLLQDNNLIMINEVSDLNSQERKYVEQFLLSVGEFSNTYTKRSRATAGGRETYDIHKLSIIITYNDIDHYQTENEYFDFMFQKAVLDRFAHFKFSGKIPSSQFITSGKLTEEEFDKISKTLRAIKYYERRPPEGIHYGIPSFYFEGVPDRHAITLTRIAEVASAYANDDHEFDRILSTIREAYDAYERMVKGVNEQPSPFEEWVR